MSVEMHRHKNRESWLKARQKYIRGSDVACILGYNPWKTNVQLFNEKKGLVAPPDLSDNPLVIYGTQAEEHIRALFALDHPEYKVEYVPDNAWRNKKYPFASASLHGWITEIETNRKGIFECTTATITSKAQSEKCKDKIPDNYYCQVLFYLGVTEFDFVILRAQLKYQLPEKPLYIITKEYVIERSEVEEDIEIVMQKAANFAYLLKNNSTPPLLLTL